MFNESGSDENRRREEARKLLDIIADLDLSNAPEKDVNFVKRTTDRFRRFGEFTRIEPKELFWLRDIKDRNL